MKHIALSLVATMVLCLASATAARAGQCPTTIDDATFVSEAELRALTAEMAGFGFRSTASKSNEQFIKWIKRQLRRIDGMEIGTERIKLRRWQPRPKAREGKGRDLAAAGALRLVQSDGTAEDVPVAGAVPYALPTSKKGVRGALVHLPPDQPITAENAAGKVILRDFPDRSIPYVGFRLLGLYLTPDLEARTGNYERPYLAALHQELLAAGTAGAAGVVFAFHVPTEQVRGYFDPHNGTHYAVPAVFVGGDQEARLKAAAGTGVSASVVVRAEADRASTRNLIATLPGQVPERIVLAVNTDGTTWVQDNGTAGVLALARYVASLPIECRPRTYEFVFGGAHLHISREGTTRYADQLDAEYDQGTVAFRVRDRASRHARDPARPRRRRLGAASRVQRGRRSVPVGGGQQRGAARGRDHGDAAAEPRLHRRARRRGASRAGPGAGDLLVRRYRRSVPQPAHPDDGDDLGAVVPLGAVVRRERDRLRAHAEAAPGRGRCDRRALDAAERGDRGRLSESPRAAGRGRADVLARPAAGAGARPGGVRRVSFEPTQAHCTGSRQVSYTFRVVRFTWDPARLQRTSASMG